MDGWTACWLPARAATFLLVVMLLPALASCGGGAAVEGEPAVVSTPDSSGSSGTPPAAPGQSGDYGDVVGGMLLDFEQAGEPFRVRVTNPDALRVIDDIIAGRASFSSISGPIRANAAGTPAYYDPWGWHLDPAAVIVNGVTPAPLRAFGIPSQVEANLAALLAAGMYKVTESRDARIVVFRDLRGAAGGGPIGPPEVPLPR